MERCTGTHGDQLVQRTPKNCMRSQGDWITGCHAHWWVGPLSPQLTSFRRWGLSEAFPGGTVTRDGHVSSLAPPLLCFLAAMGEALVLCRPAPALESADHE